MHACSTLFEGIMILCFGLSWPSAIAKTLKTRHVEGKSAAFLWLIFTGYVSGILFKVSEYLGAGRLNPVIALYIFNALMVAIEIVLYYRFRGNGLIAA